MTAPAAPAPNLTPARFEYTAALPGILAQLGCSLLVSTYQAGKLVVVGTHAGALTFAFHGFEQAMGVAVSPRRVAVGAKKAVWFLDAQPDLARRVGPPGAHDACFLARTCHVTGAIHGHEMAWGGADGRELWVVNTLFSCLCTLAPDSSFVPRWRPPFITQLAGEDRCHLNGMALADGAPKYVTVLGETDTAAGWRPGKATGGRLLDVPGGNAVVTGLCMPHSPRVYDGKVWVLDSGHGRLSVVDVAAGRAEPVAHLPGYTRGLGFAGPFAFVGLSRIRETSVFGGIPIAEDREKLRCGVGVVDLRTGQPVAALTFFSGVEEIFAVAVLPGARNPVVRGPNPDADGHDHVWVVAGPPS